jgi:hypothetical protein
VTGKAAPLSAGFVAAWDDPDLFGITLTPRQRELLAAVDAAGCSTYRRSDREVGSLLS